MWCGDNTDHGQMVIKLEQKKEAAPYGVSLFPIVLTYFMTTLFLPQPLDPGGLWPLRLLLYQLP